MRYTFRPATHADLPLFREWLATPEVIRWWGDPDEQFALLRGDLDEPAMDMRGVEDRGRPFAYVQDYAVHIWPQEHFATLPPGARGMDAFIGDPAMIGRGHGSAFLRQRAQRLVDEGAPVVAIDPDIENLRARRAYAKAGFVLDRIVDTESGPEVLMLFGPGVAAKLTL